MTTHVHPRRSREELTELLSAAEPAQIIALADTVIGSLDEDELHITRPPETGTIVAQVREPLAEQRFILGDLIASTAEVALAEVRGWAMRLGDDRHAALAQAVLDAEVLRAGPAAEEILALADQVADHRHAQRAAEWERLVPTIVEFEEIA
ncbi:hypothetical protein GCM10022261_05420 [Brevibacterium daeguense]|uniref:Alpha-D-ribose 1-methylphosphonate 5-triphosphate synthase subunit PhnG n=1 Tax=Brevibacterium daeguense TaxID=909936 RepID=A0ABP8EGD5_9MICO|nr:phosphonate C-P lyase system protein PhnG [Brevibacterium daeguense]